VLKIRLIFSPYSPSSELHHEPTKIVPVLFIAMAAFHAAVILTFQFIRPEDLQDTGKKIDIMSDSLPDEIHKKAF